MTVTPLDSPGLLDPAEVARREERRQALGMAEVADDVLEVGGGTACFAGRGSWVNLAAGLGLDGPVAPADLDRVVAFYVERGVEPKVEVAPTADPSLLLGLAERGFVLRAFEHVLVRPLPPGEDLWALAPHPLPADLELEPLDRADEAAVRRYADLTSRGFFGEAEEPAPELLEPAVRVSRHPLVECVLARIDGEPAGGGHLEVRDGVGCLIGASVMTRFRRRGVQTALTLRRLELARARGVAWVCVHSSPGVATERTARRLGFALAYTKVILARPGEGLAPSP